MAINSDLPCVKPSSAITNSSSSSTSSSLSPFNRRKRLLQVATNNSASFIQFPANARQASPFVPINHPRTSYSSTCLPIHTADSQSLSNQSKSSVNAHSSSNASDDPKRSHSQHRINPILSNPLLNHRKEQPKSLPIKSSNEYSRTTRLCLSSKPLRATSNDTHKPIIRANTAPHLVHKKDTHINISDRLIIPIDKKSPGHQIQYVDANKYDYITRWLNEIRAATYSNEISRTKSKRTKRGPLAR